jgi:hypothetical protein
MTTLGFPLLGVKNGGGVQEVSGVGGSGGVAIQQERCGGRTLHRNLFVKLMSATLMQESWQV